MITIIDESILKSSAKAKTNHLFELQSTDTPSPNDIVDLHGGDEPLYWSPIPKVSTLTTGRKLKMRTVYKQAKKEVFEKAERIFGSGIVESVCITTWEDVIDKKRMKKDLFKYEDGLLDEDYFDIGGLDIIIKFISGNHVQFTNSEWGTMKKVDLNDSAEFVSI